MELSSKKKLNRMYCLLAFALPVIGMLVVMILRGSKPFGDYSMLYSDMYHQYYPFFVSFRRALLSGESLLYNWDVGMGIDYLALIAYYLASPLNLLSIFVPEKYLLEFFSLLMPIKLGLASLFFSIFLSKVYHKQDFSVVLFGCFYSLCAWALGYQWNIMWLDTFALLPLVVLGMVSLLQEKKVLLYTASLFLAVFSNYYIGLFVCIFVALSFFCYEICRPAGFRKFLADLLRIAIFSALAIGMTAILELPAFAALQDTQSSVNTFPTGFSLNITKSNTWLGLLDAMRQVAGNLNGGLEPTFKEGLPNLYCGVGSMILAFLFLTCKQVKLRDKLCSVFLLLLFVVSFIVRQLDYIWHGFHFPNMIPYRFSFLFSFVMLNMAYRAYLLRHRFRLWQVIAAGLLAIGVALCTNDLSDPVFWAYNSVFILLYLSVILYAFTRYRLPKKIGHNSIRTHLDDRRYRLRIGTFALFGIFSIELILNLVNFGVTFSRTSVINYPKGTEYSESMIRYMKEREDDTLFYRAEVTHSQTLNDGALNSYHGISAFTSSANVKVTEFMQALGYGARNTYNRYCFEESSPISNLFLSLKYMLERDGQFKENAYFDTIHQYGSVSLLKNNAYLPLGFLANPQLINVDIATNTNNLIFQNELLRAASGISEDAWSLIIGNYVSIKGKDTVLTSKTQTGYCTYTAGETGGSVIYTYTANKAGLVCIDLSLSMKNNFSVWKNGAELYSETYSLPQTLSVCNVVPGDTVEIYLTCKPSESGTIRIHAGILDEAVFREAYSTLSTSVLELTSFENTRIEGTIHCDRNGVLYTSIPQGGNWTATVDGKPAEIVLIGDAMVGLLLSEGEHTVTFTYRNKAFSLGWKISLLCLMIFLALYFTAYKPRRYIGKREIPQNNQLFSK